MFDNNDLMFSRFLMGLSNIEKTDFRKEVEIEKRAFGSYIPERAKKMSYPDGVQYLFKFDNGYGASVVWNDISYGHEEGLYELAVLGPDDRLCYTTSVTDVVLGYLTPEEVAEKLKAIENLAL